MGKENEGGFSGFWDAQSSVMAQELSEAGDAAKEERSTALVMVNRK